MKTLQLNSSIKPQSESAKYADMISNHLKNKGSDIIVRDLVKDPVATLDTAILMDLFGENKSKEVLQYNELIEELKSVNYLVITAPMYNFNIPTQLKNYFDAICRAGVTFKYTETGPVGLLNIEKAYVVLSRGGLYFEKGVKFQEQYLETLLKFVGVKEVEFILVEGLNMGPDMAQKAHLNASQWIEKKFA